MKTTEEEETKFVTKERHRNKDMNRMKQKRNIKNHIKKI